MKYFSIKICSTHFRDLPKGSILVKQLLVCFLHCPSITKNKDYGGTILQFVSRYPIP